MAAARDQTARVVRSEPAADEGEKTRDPSVVLADHLRAHLSEDLTLHELAMLLGISVRHLSRVVRREKGVSLHRWIADYRLNEARRLLSETDLPIHEVARLSAFRSSAAFSTAFRAASGFAPSEYRRLQV